MSCTRGLLGLAAWTLVGCLPGFAHAAPAPGSEQTLLLEGLPVGSAQDKDLRRLLRDSGARARVLADGAEAWTVESGEGADTAARLRGLIAERGGLLGTWNAGYADLFRQVPEMELQPVQQKQLSALQQSAGGTVTVVELAPGPLASFALTEGFGRKDGFSRERSFRLPLAGGKSVALARTGIEFGGDYAVWKGAVGESPVVLLTRGKDLRGVIRLEDRIVSILPLGNGAHAIREILPADMPPDHPEGLDPAAPDLSAFDTAPPAPVSAEEIIYIDVLAVYSPAVATLYRDVGRDLVDYAIEATNASFVSNGLPGLRLRRVHVQELPFIETGIWKDYQRWLQTPGDGVLDEVFLLREKYRADVVVNFVSTRGGCGVSGGVYADKGTAFATVSAACAGEELSLAHEIGHLIGAAHEVELNDAAPFPFGRGYLARNRKWRSIMASGRVCGAGCIRQPVWSNPYREFLGEPAGREQDAYDLRILREHARRVSEFM